MFFLSVKSFPIKPVCVLQDLTYLILNVHIPARLCVFFQGEGKGENQSQENPYKIIRRLEEL